PEWVPFFADDDIVRAADVPQKVIEAARRAEAEQVERAVGDASPEAVFAFSDAYLGSMVHDVNLVHGLLERLSEPFPVEVADAAGASADRHRSADSDVPCRYVTSFTPATPGRAAGSAPRPPEPQAGRPRERRCGLAPAPRSRPARAPPAARGTRAAERCLRRMGRRSPLPRPHPCRSRRLGDARARQRRRL